MCIPVAIRPRQTFGARFCLQHPVVGGSRSLVLGIGETCWRPEF